MKNSNKQFIKEWYTVTEIAQHFNVSESLVRILIREKKLKHHRVGRKIIIKPSEFEETVIRTVDPAPATAEKSPRNEKEPRGVK